MRSLAHKGGVSVVLEVTRLPDILDAIGADMPVKEDVCARVRSAVGCAKQGRQVRIDLRLRVRGELDVRNDDSGPADFLEARAQRLRSHRQEDAFTAPCAEKSIYCVGFVENASP